MALIKLALLAKIRLECFHFKNTVETSSLDTSHWAKTKMTDQSYVTMYCRWLQADNLFMKLDMLHETAKDFAAGNIQKELDIWLEFYADEGLAESDPFVPFDVFEWKFKCGTLYDLPKDIEQYAELLQFAKHFTTMVQAKNEAFDHFFGKMTKYYPATDENGESVMVPEADLSPEMQEQVRLGQVVNEIEDVDAEFALVQYNDFYAACELLFDTYRPTGDYQSCAAGILSLFA